MIIGRSLLLSGYFGAEYFPSIRSAGKVTKLFGNLLKRMIVSALSGGRKG